MVADEGGPRAEEVHDREGVGEKRDVMLRFSPRMTLRVGLSSSAARILPVVRRSVLSPPDCASAAFRVPLRSELSPEEAILWLRGDRGPFALIGDWLGGMTILGSEPLRVLGDDQDPFAVLGSQSAPRTADDVAVGGGWIGWLGYQLGARIERLPPPPPPRVAGPPFSLAYHDHVILFDGEQWWFEGLGSSQREPQLRARLELWEGRLRAAPPPGRVPRRIGFEVASNGTDGHTAAVADCRERIVAGELLQANICLRLEGRFDGEALDLFALASARARPRFAALTNGLVSVSPERFLRRDGRHVWSEPIKGTGTRSGSETDQDAGRDALSASAKDAAEHVMIVDLMRNDLGRVCTYGTLTVQPRRVEPHGALWHMVTTVSGQLRDDVDDGALLRATFPPGSVTGAPKIQAMKVIASLEATRREAYTGAIGIFSPIAGVDLSVSIRTFELRGEHIWLGAGGGIVADSDPGLELGEALAKASGPIAAIGGRIMESPAHEPRATDHADLALRFGDRPDPSRGVFETVLVQDGSAQHLGAHLERFARSIDDVYGHEPPSDLEARVASAARACSSRSRLWILADADGSVAIRAQAAPVSDQTPVRLHPFAIPGGLGPHKWRDRALLEALAACDPGTVPLLVDTDGQVLEAAHANVWIVDGDSLITIPFDGRVLPGVTAAALLESHGQARAEPFDLDRMACAEKIFLTSTVRGRHPALLLPGSADRAPRFG